LKQILLLLFLTIMISACGSPSSTPIPSLQERAWVACTNAVEDETGISSSKAPRYTDNQVTTLEENRFEVEVEYADLDKTYRCELLQLADGNWQLKNLEVK